MGNAFVINEGDTAIMYKLDPILDAALSVALSRKSYCGGIECFQQAMPQIRTDLDKQIQDLKSNDLGQIEALLYSQAVTLNEIFNTNIRLLSFSNKANDMQVYSQIAFKAQNQCRNTLAALAEIKLPNRTIFVRQQNNAFNQQINCAKNELPEKNPTNELLEADNERVDIRTEITPVTVNSSVEAMDKINGGENN